MVVAVRPLVPPVAVRAKMPGDRFEEIVMLALQAPVTSDVHDPTAEPLMEKLMISLAAKPATCAVTLAPAWAELGVTTSVGVTVKIALALSPLEPCAATT